METVFKDLKSFDDRAWGMLFDSYNERLLKDIVFSLRRRGMSDQYAEDVASETWLIAIEKITEFDCRDLETLYHWLRVISYNRVRNLMRKKEPDGSLQDVEAAHEKQNGMSLDSFLSTYDLVNASPEKDVEQAAQWQRVEEALQKLTPREREIWLRRHLDGDSPCQIAKDYDLKPRSISQHLGRTRKKLRAYMDAQTS